MSVLKFKQLENRSRVGRVRQPPHVNNSFKTPLAEPQLPKHPGHPPINSSKARWHPQSKQVVLIHKAHRAHPSLVSGDNLQWDCLLLRTGRNGSGHSQAGQGKQFMNGEPIFRNLSAVLEKATSSLEKATKVNVLLADMGDFAAMNEIYTMVPKPVATRKAEGASRITS
ncbi:hypothetical protein ACO22_04928 [Paracoccidioides brasiliensis]|uniref:Uncharacterized protein n=1 Tax=Paracoccidioides brasiliensis TaxID=121759 RepID=A0A1D2JBW0_PARBR|nr:hypothetical protein ACO22_04928 [Paracoccidioides brasiliensis]